MRCCFKSTTLTLANLKVMAPAERTTLRWRELGMSGKTIIITGGNRGLGKETAFQLAKRGARVILACRNQETAIETAKEITSETGNPNVIVKKLDLSSLEGTRDFANLILNTEKRLDVLINNAGCMQYEKVLTAEGLETTFVTNYLGHFLLTQMLLPLLKKTNRSRIIFLSSLLYLFGSMDPENLNAEKKFGKTKMYCDSKVCMLLYVKELSEQLRGTGVTVNAVHPGVIMTDILHGVHPLLFFIFRVIRPLCCSLKKGARTSVYLSVSENVTDVSGKFFWNCRTWPTLPKATDKIDSKALWKISHELCNLYFELEQTQL